MKGILLATAVGFSLAITGCATAVVPGTGTEEAIALAVADPLRPAEDVARDGLRKPAEIIAFAGVEPGMTVMEYAPGGGYYTRLLARAVGPQGKVYTLASLAQASRPGGLDDLNALAAQYGNVEVVAVDYANFTLPEPVDLAWTTENYHDFVNAGSIMAMDGQTLKALKPGGIFFVEDHNAPGTGATATRILHRIDVEEVVRNVTAAGFILEARSNLLVNPNDPHTANPREVEPTSDKFALRFRKPG